MEKQTVRIRRYSPDDTSEIMQLFHGTIREVNIRDYSQKQVEVWAPNAMDRAAWERTLSERITFVAEEEGSGEGSIAGFGELEEDGHINRFYVGKNRQGQGVGSLLMNAIEAEAKGRAIQRLYVEASITARPFFERQGFITLAEQTVTVRDMDFINYRMEKRLDSVNSFF